MGSQLLLALPRGPLQIIVLERMDEDFRLIQPRGVRWRMRAASTTPDSWQSTLVLDLLCGLTHHPGSRKFPATPCDAGDRVPIREDRVHCRSAQECQLHQPRMHHQEHQHVHGPMPSIVELLLLNRAGDRPAKGLTLQNLEGRDLIDTNDPDALFRQSLRIPISTKGLAPLAL